MFKKIVNIVLLTLVCTGILHSQINLHSFMSRAVRQGRRTGTHIDSLVLNTKVNAGSAQTRITIVAQPLGGILNKTTMKPTPLDSVEMTLNFSIPSDFVADSMWLWVDGKPVEAYIQDRALASSQYNQIVGTRRDPALLQYSGNGMYNLRIFPAESYKSRKIAIQFHHTFDDNIAGGISTSIPVVFDSTYCLYKNKYESIPRQIDCITAMFSTPDQYSYKIVLPGVGSGTFSNAQSLSLSCRNVVDLKQGTIIGNDPSGVNKFLWLSRDKIKGKTIAGVTVTLADSNVIFEDEPKMRIIALDIRNKIWNWNEYYKARAEHLGQNYNANPRFQDFNILLRAQKYAVLCLRHYLDGAKEFNIVIGGKSVQTLFDKPVPAKAESIKLALEAIQEMTPDGFSSTSQVMDAACSQANEGIVILISDLFEPYNYFEPNNPKRYSLSSTGIEYNNMLDYIDNLVDSTGIVLFTIDDNYRLSGISFNSGGYRIGRLLDRYYIDYRYEVINGKRITIPMMPPLFGSRNNSGIRKLDVTSENLTDIVYTKDGYTYNYWYSRSAVTEDVVENDLDRPFTVPDPYYRPYNPKSTILRIAGVSGTLQPREVAFNITGRLGGLKFRKNFIASTSLNATTLYGEVQWAFRKSESLAQENYSGNVLTIKAIGKQYHIITRQTSLLALEPGMDLWEDTLVASNERVTTNTGAEGAWDDGILWKAAGEPAIQHQSNTSKEDGIDFDEFSLDDLILQKGITEIAGNLFNDRPVAMSAKVNGGMVRLVVPHIKDKVVLKLFDIKGCLVLQRILNPSEIKGSLYNWDISREAKRLSKGFYMLDIATDIQKKIFRIPLVGK